MWAAASGSAGPNEMCGSTTPGRIRALPPVPLLARVRDTIQVKHYNTRTARALGVGIRRFVMFDGKRHPSDLGGTEVAAVLTHMEQMID